MSDEFKRVTFETNDYLLKEGEYGDTAYLITSGKVEVRLGALGNNPQTLAVMGKGGVIGEMSLLDNSPHMASVIASEKTVVTALSMSEFNRRVDQMDPLMRGILKIMVNRLREMGKNLSEEKEEANFSRWKTG